MARPKSGAWNQAIVIFLVCSAAAAQGNQSRVAMLPAGTVIPVRVQEAIDVQRSDISAAAVLTSRINRVYRAVVNQDVRGEGQQVAIPKGASAELMVRVGRSNKLVLDLESITAGNHRYAVRAQPSKVEPKDQDIEVGEVMGEVIGGDSSGVKVQIPVDAVVTFQLKKQLDVDVADQGETRDGIHYHHHAATTR